MTDDRLGRLRAGLTEAQRRAVEVDDAPLCVLAGAGSGKTTVLTRRVARRVLDGSAAADHTLVATFTRKAADELRRRLRRLEVPGRVWAGTFHAAAFGQLRRHRADRGQRPPALLEDPARLVRDPAVAGPGLDPDMARVLVGELQWAQSRLVEPDAYESAARAERRHVPVPADEVAACFARYVEAKRVRGLLDLGDLLVEAARVCEEDATAAAALRWRVRHLYVDEFQDVNPAQYRLLRAWLGERADLFVVGDPSQAVYAWNGADPTLLDRIQTILPGTTVLRLEHNHRSTPQVLGAAHRVLPTAAPLDPDTAPAARRPDGPDPVVGRFDDDAGEAAAVARWLRLANHPGRAWSHMAVLARTNRRLDRVADALARAGIPHRRAGGAAPADPGTTAGVLRALRAARAGAALRPALTDAAEAAGDGAVTPPALAQLADEYALEDAEPTVGAFLSWVSATVGARGEDVASAVAGAGFGVDDGDDGARGGQVVLSTFHRAKGLEWPVVAVVGLEDGLSPIAYATSRAALDEERRLLYVAITRAEEELWCSWAARRIVGGVERQCECSPFLDGLGTTGPARLPADEAAARVAELRSRLAATG